MLFNDFNMEKNKALIDYWPRISFEEIENVQEDGISSVFYHTVLSFLCFPQRTVASFVTLFKTAVL